MVIYHPLSCCTSYTANFCDFGTAILLSLFTVVFVGILCCVSSAGKYNIYILFRNQRMTKLNSCKEGSYDDFVDQNRAPERKESFYDKIFVSAFFNSLCRRI